MAQTVSIIVGPEDFRPSRPTSSSPSSAAFLHLLSVSVHQAITAAGAVVGLKINFVHSRHGPSSHDGKLATSSIILDLIAYSLIIYLFFHRVRCRFAPIRAGLS